MIMILIIKFRFYKMIKILLSLKTNSNKLFIFKKDNRRVQIDNATDEE